LSGLGGDEMSAGYERYLGLKLLGYYWILPETLRKEIIARLVSLIPYSKTGSPWIERMKRFVRISDLPFEESYYSISSKIDPEDKKKLFSSQTINEIGSGYSTSKYFQQFASECKSTDELNKMLYIDMNMYMVEQLLVLSDRMSMANSLEMRVPFLDHLLVENFGRVEPSMKLRGLCKKYLLKKVAERYFPKKFIYRKKMGFSSPIVLWLRNDLKNYMLRILNRKSIEKTGILNADTVEQYAKEHISSKHNHDTKLWSIMMFMIWYDKYIDRIYI